LPFKKAEALEIALMKQKGVVAYFLLDGNPDWLHQQDALQRDFLGQLARIKDAAEAASQGRTLEEIEAEYGQYITQKSRVVELIRSGNAEAGAALHRSAHARFEALMHLCDRLKQFHTDRILAAHADSHAQAQRLRIVALSAISFPPA